MQQNYIQHNGKLQNDIHHNDKQKNDSNNNDKHHNDSNNNDKHQNNIKHSSMQKNDIQQSKTIILRLSTMTYTTGRIFSRVRPFYERAVSNLDSLCIDLYGSRLLTAHS
jgi:hypothetical protein